MAWQVTGQWLEVCSCKMHCPCWLGPGAEPDQGYCAGALIFDIQQGQADGIDLSDSKVVFVADWPGDFWAGQGTARLYLDQAASADQRRVLEAIFSGKNGGPLEPVWGAVISKWLPAQATNLAIRWGDSPSITVGDIGQVQAQALKTEDGRQVSMQNAPAAVGLQLGELNLARTDGSRFANPEMRAWQSGGSGNIGRFTWSA